MNESAINIMQLSSINRVGLKGPNARKWLQENGLEVPTDPNNWLKTTEGVLVVQLGNSDFMVESTSEHAIFAKILTAPQPIAEGVYRVARADAAFTLSGEHLPDLLAESCALDLRPEAISDGSAIVTQFAGISATLIYKPSVMHSEYRLWCDASYGDYLQEVLQELTHDLLSAQRGRF